MGGTPLVKTINLTDANAQRIIAAYRLIYDMPLPVTAAKLWNKIGQGTFDGIKENTINQEVTTQRTAIVVPDIVET